MEQVVPGSIVYSDLKPEAILSDIKLVKYYPTSNVNGYLPQDLIRFELRGNGYFDPFSAYIYTEITIPVPTASAALLNGVGATILDDSAHSLIYRLVIRSEGTELERLENYDVLAKMLNDITMTEELRASNPYLGLSVTNAHRYDAHKKDDNAYPLAFLTPGSRNTGIVPVFNDVGVYRQVASVATTTTGNADTTDELYGLRAINQAQTKDGKFMAFTYTGVEIDGAGIIAGSYVGTASTTTLKFAFPLYSGILGVLMQEKKLLPLSYLPLEVEFTLNPYAFYGYGSAVSTAIASRTYTINKFELHTHVISFEHEVALYMDAVVARQGLYIPFESFFYAAQTVSSESGVDTSITIPVNAHFKSITSLHMVAIPSGFESNATQKKLYFVSCNAKKLYIRNGINYLPSLPIEGIAGDSYNNGHAPFYMEMLKSWNRLHDHATPVPIPAFNYSLNSYWALSSATQTAKNLLPMMSAFPRCYYGISFLGEELGKDYSTITGKRGLTPFSIEFYFTKPYAAAATGAITSVSATQATSVYFIPYVRADFLLYIRPDLVVQVLGK